MLEASFMLKSYGWWVGWVAHKILVLTPRPLGTDWDLGLTGLGLGLGDLGFGTGLDNNSIFRLVRESLRWTASPYLAPLTRKQSTSFVTLAMRSDFWSATDSTQALFLVKVREYKIYYHVKVWHFLHGLSAGFKEIIFLVVKNEMFKTLKCIFVVLS